MKWKLLDIDSKERAVILALLERPRVSYGDIANGVKKHGYNLSRQGAKDVFERLEQKGITYRKNGKYYVNRKRVKNLNNLTEVLTTTLVPIVIGSSIILTGALIFGFQVDAIITGFVAFLAQSAWAYYKLRKTPERKEIYILSKTLHN